MTLPGHQVTIGSRPAARSVAPSTSNGFVVGITERGPSDRAVLVRSLSQYVDNFGGRITNGPLYDYLDVAFREGASAVYVARLIGPAPVLATRTIPAASGNSFRIDAASYGTWGNGIGTQVSLTGGAGSPFIVTVTYGGATVETSPALATVDEAVAWSASSHYIRIVKLTANMPVAAAAANLTAGTDDSANATDATRLAALNLFTRSLGPGQVAQPGFTTSQSYTDLLAHAVANNRRALLDLVDTATAATLTAATTALRTAASNGARLGAAYAPWAVVPGLTPGTTRTVPYTAVQMGLISRAESEGANSGQAVAGKRGRARYATGLSQGPWDATTRDTLNESGVNVARILRDTVTTYGDRSLTNPLTDGDWKSFAASRLMMDVAGRCNEVMEDYDFEQIDGKGNIFAKLAGDLNGEIVPLFIAGALYGESPDEAFTVNTGPDVNTPTTIAAEELHAQVACRVSPEAEMLTTEIVKVPITEAL